MRSKFDDTCASPVRPMRLTVRISPGRNTTPVRSLSVVPTLLRRPLDVQRYTSQPVRSTASSPQLRNSKKPLASEFASPLESSLISTVGVAPYTGFGSVATAGAETPAATISRAASVAMAGRSTRQESPGRVNARRHHGGCRVNDGSGGPLRRARALRAVRRSVRGSHRIRFRPGSPRRFRRRCARR